MDAAKKNNAEKIAMQWTEAPFGGNKAMLTKLLGLEVHAEEATLSNWQGPQSGMGVVALQLILDFNAKCESPLLKPDVTRVGISVQNCSQCTNLIQLLYVSVPMQPPTNDSWAKYQQQQQQ